MRIAYRVLQKTEAPKEPNRRRFENEEERQAHRREIEERKFRRRKELSAPEFPGKNPSAQSRSVPGSYWGWKRNCR